MGRITTLKRKAYDSAKISVNRGMLFKPETIGKLSELKFDEVLKFLSDNGFAKVIDQSYSRYEGFYLIEKILNDYLSTIYNKVVSSASKDNRILLEEYYFKYQIHNLMVLIRCKISKAENIEPYLIGSSNKQMMFVKAYEMQGVEEPLRYIAKKLKLDTDLVLQKYKEGLYELENYLYKEYYNRITSYKFKYNFTDENEFSKFLRRYIDLINARSYLKIHSEGMKGITFKDIFVEGGRLPLSFFEKLEGNNQTKLLEVFSKEFKDESAIEEFSSVTQLDKEISKHKEVGAKMFKKVRFGSPFFAFKYLFEVERQIGKLRVILKAKYLGLTKEEVLKLI